VSIARDVDDGARLVVRAKPRSKREGVELDEAGGSAVVVVRINAPPVDGKANERVREVLAKLLEVPRSRVTIVRGESAREKDIAVAGMSAAQVEARLRAAW
jgi:uncharacterized protein (TIGR00251 family)